MSRKTIRTGEFRYETVDCKHCGLDYITLLIEYHEERCCNNPQNLIQGRVIEKFVEPK